jgi:hypothetical protein
VRWEGTGSMVLWKPRERFSIRKWFTDTDPAEDSKKSNED